MTGATETGPTSRDGGKKKLLTAGAWAFIGKVSAMLAVLAANMVLARLLTPAEMGAYFLLFSMVTVAAQIAQFGLPTTIVRVIGESVGRHDPGRAKVAIAAGFRHATLIALLVALLLLTGGGDLLVGRLLHLRKDSALLPLAAGWTIFLTWQAMQAAVLRGVHDLRAFAIFGGSLGNLLYACVLLVLWLAFRQANLNEVVVSAVAATALSVAFGYLVVRKKTAALTGEGVLGPRDLMGVSLPVFIVMSLNSLLNQSDLWVMSLFAGPEEVAYYGAASRLAGSIPFLLAITYTVISPLIAELGVQDRKEELEKLVRNAAAAAFIPSLVPLLLFLLFGAEVLSLCFGENYRSAAPLLALLAAGRSFSVWTGACGVTLMMTGHQTSLMKITICCSLVTVAASVLSAKVMGGIGVALATSLGLMLQSVVVLLCARRKAGIWTHARLPLPDVGPVPVGRDFD